MADDDQIALLRAEIDSLRSQVARMEASAPLGNRGQQWQLDEHDIQIKRLLSMIGTAQSTSAGASGAIPVSLGLAGGSNGGPSTPPTFTYTAFDLTKSQSIPGGPFSPTSGRSNGAYNTALMGFGYYTSSGGFVLVVAFETPRTAFCPVPP